MKTLALLLPLLAATASKALVIGHREDLTKRASSSKPGYTTTFWDDFTGSPGSLPSSSNWIFDTGTSYPGGPAHWGNNELETYTKSTANVHISSEQSLVIIPVRSSSGAWTSARLETQRSDFAAVSGKKLYIEASIRLGQKRSSEQQGIWPAFWALGASFRSNVNSWPAPSEWDFMENLNGETIVFSTLHCGTAPGGPCNEYDGIGDGGVSVPRAGFHTYGFQVDRTSGTWKDETITYYVDGKSVLSVSGAEINDQNTWTEIAHQGHFLLLNVAIGGNWPGNPNSKTADGTGVQMEIDYVGVWNSN